MMHLANRLSQSAMLATYLAFVLPPASVRAEKLLQLKYEKGQKWRTEIKQETNIRDGIVRLHQEIVLHQMVEDVDDDGIATIKQKFERIKVVSEGAPYSYDSAVKDKAKNFGEVLRLVFEPLLETPCTSRISPNAEVIDLVMPATVQHHLDCLLLKLFGKYSTRTLGVRQLLLAHPWTPLSFSF